MKTYSKQLFTLFCTLILSGTALADEVPAPLVSGKINVDIREGTEDQYAPATLSISVYREDTGDQVFCDDVVEGSVQGVTDSLAASPNPIHLIPRAHTKIGCEGAWVDALGWYTVTFPPNRPVIK